MELILNTNVIRKNKLSHIAMFGYTYTVDSVATVYGACKLASNLRHISLR